MASAVYEVLPLLPRLPFRVSSAACVQADNGSRQQVLLGCHDGSLRVYDVQEGTDPTVREVRVLPKFSPGKKPVEMLTFVQNWGILLSMSPSGVAWNYLPSFKSGGLVYKTKSCTTFCCSPSYLIVAARKKVRVHKWNGSAMKFEHYKDHVTTDEALSLVWTGDNTVIVGFKNEYTVLNIETGDTRRVFETRHTLAAANFVPRTTLIGELHSNHRSRSASRASGSHRMLTTSGASGGSAVDDEEIPSVEALLVKGSKNGAQGIFVGPNGRPTRTIGYCIQWPSTPSTLVSSRDFPYVVSAHPRAIEVHNILTMSLAQSVPLPGAISVTAFLPHTTRFDGGGSGAGAGAGAGSGAEPSTSRTPEHVLVVCPNDVFVLRMVPLVMQVAALVSRRPAEFEEALALCEHCHSEGIREEKIRQIRGDFGYELFAQGEFHGALSQLWWAAEPVKRVLGLFPQLLPEGLTLQTSYPVNMPHLAGAALAEALQALIPYLEKQRERLASGSGDRDDDSGSDDEDADRQRRQGSGVMLPSAVLVDTVLVTAYLRRAGGVSYATSDSDGETLIDHDFDIDALDGLGDHHPHGGRSTHTSTATDDSGDTGVDRGDLSVPSTHTSEKARANRALARLLTGPNKCYVEECELQLRQHRKWVELPLLYKGKGLHRKALELLAMRLENAATGGRRRKRLAALVEYLKVLGDGHRTLVFEFLRPLLSTKRAGIASRHVDNTVASSYASNGGGNEDLTLTATQRAALSVLTSVPAVGANALDPDAVLEFLNTGGYHAGGIDASVLGSSPARFGTSLGSTGAAAPISTSVGTGGGAGTGNARLGWDPAVLCVEYLEFLIYKCDDTVVMHHNELVLQYLRVIQPLLERTRRIRVRRAAAARERRRARQRRSSQRAGRGGNDGRPPSSGDEYDPFGAGQMELGTQRSDTTLEVQVARVRRGSGTSTDSSRSAQQQMPVTPRLRNRARAGSEAGELGLYRRRLLQLLETSNLYTPSTLLTTFPTHDLFEERALLLGKLGQHEAALRVYAHQLKDDVMAAEYCDKVYRTGGREGKDVYLTLLRAYTNPPRHKSRRNRSRTALGGLGLAGGGHYSSDGGEEGWVSSGSFRDHRGDSDGEGGGDGGDGDDDDKASGEDTQELIERIGAVMQILATNVSRVDTTRVIELLPTFVPVALVCPLLEGVIRHQSDTQRQLQINKQLCRLQHLNTEAALNKQKARATKIGVSRVCPVCQRRIGKAAFALYPNGVVVHFGCCKDKHVCPVSGTRFADALKLDAVVGTLSGVTTRSRRHSSVSSDLWTRLRAHSGLGQAPPPPSSASRRIASARASRAAPPTVPLRSGRRGSARG